MCGWTKTDRSILFSRIATKKTVEMLTNVCEQHQGKYELRSFNEGNNEPVRTLELQLQPIFSIPSYPGETAHTYGPEPILNHLSANVTSFDSQGRQRVAKVYSPVVH